MNNKEFFLLKVVNEERYLARMSGSGSDSKDPFFLTSVPDFAIRVTSILDLYITILDFKESESMLKRYALQPVCFEMNLEQMSFAKPIIYDYKNILASDFADKIISLDLSLLKEKERSKFENIYKEYELRNTTTEAE